LEGRRRISGVNPSSFSPFDSSLPPRGKVHPLQCLISINAIYSNQHQTNIRFKRGKWEILEEEGGGGKRG